LLPPAACRLEFGARDASAKLGQFRTLRDGGLDCSPKLRVRLIFSLLTGSHQQQFTSLPVKLDVAPALAVGIRDGERFINEPKPCHDPSGPTVEPGEQAKVVRNAQSSIGSPEIL
jgi:hypothetical protein